ncbi:MAG TPA: site-2 protease family protein [Candidatus Limnocylindrales bacterium]
MSSLAIAQAVIFVGMFLLISGPVHECAHAFVAWRLGDGTAKLFGRISLNPVRHFDPIGGTLLAGSVLLSLIAGGAGVGFGWAKPTPVNPYNLKGRHADSIVAAAGPLSNLILAVLFAAGFQILNRNGIEATNTSAINMVQLVFQTGIVLNVMLMIFNLLPIPPLDGSHVLFDLLDPRTSQQLRGVMNQYGMMILVLVVFFGSRFIYAAVIPVVNFLAGVRIYN